MLNNMLIYVAGNPDLYPLEYYDARSRSYCGAIPELLADFAAKHGYDIVYHQPGTAGKRLHLAENPQVHVISGVVSGQCFPGNAGALTLFRTDAGGDSVEYGLAFTETAPEEFVRALTSYAAERSESAIMGELLAAMEHQMPGAGHAPPSVPGGGMSVPLAVLLTVSRWEKRQLVALEREREMDACTGLYNQLGLERMFQETVNEENRAGYDMLCFHFELGHIERMDGPGAAAGFLRHTADVLRCHARDGSVVARGDNGNFFVLCPAESADGARNWAMRALDDIMAYSCAGASLSHRDAGVGVFPLSARACGYDQVLYYAQQCAISALRGGQGAKICGANNCRICEEERELLGDLKRGIALGEFRLHLQLVVAARDFRPVGAEALSRWIHPQKGLLNPDRYVPLLEKEERIDRLDFYNLDRACRFLEALHSKEDREDFFISCNLSRRSFVQADLTERCREILEQYHFPRRELIIEITESGYICGEEIEQMRRNIQAVRTMGVRVMLDDFGMGYATFHDLLEFPMDGLKLDKSLVDNMNTEQGQIVLNGIISTAHRLGLIVLAEGVEEEWQVEELRRLNCDLLQGYFFSMPLPAGEALDRLPGQDQIRHQST